MLENADSLTPKQIEVFMDNIPKPKSTKFSIAELRSRLKAAKPKHNLGEVLREGVIRSLKGALKLESQQVNSSGKSHSPQEIFSKDNNSSFYGDSRIPKMAVKNLSVKNVLDNDGLIQKVTEPDIIVKAEDLYKKMQNAPITIVEDGLNELAKVGVGKVNKNIPTKPIREVVVGSTASYAPPTELPNEVKVITLPTPDTLRWQGQNGPTKPLPGGAKEYVANILGTSSNTPAKK